MQVQTEISLSHPLLSYFEQCDEAEQIEIAEKVAEVANALRKYEGLERLQVFNIYLDRAIQADLELFQEHHPEFPIACSNKCSWCCDMDIAVFEEEAEYLAKLVKRGEITYHKKRFKRQKNATPEDFHKNRYQCIFLEDGQCSIYNKRPATCRKYFAVTTSDNCRKMRAGEISQVPGPLLFNAEIIYTAMSRVSPYHRKSSLPAMLAAKLSK